MQSKAISFKGQKVFIGIDVHKKTWSVTTLLEVGMPKTHSQKASAKELFDFLNRHYPEAEYHAVYEAGFSGFSTYYALKEYGIECTVVNAADVPTTQYESVMKSDPIDSDKMARALRAGMIKGIYIREKDNLDDRGLVRLRKSIQQDLTRYKNRVQEQSQAPPACKRGGDPRVVRPFAQLVQGLHQLATRRSSSLIFNSGVTGHVD